MPEGFNLKNLQNIDTFTPNPWKTSPKNLATWYLIKDTMYVTPNVDMILRQIRKDQATSRAGLPDLSSMTELYAALNRWSTTGVKLICQPNPWKDNYVLNVTQKLPFGNNLSMSMFSKYEGDYLVYISKEELMPLIPLLKNLMTDEMVKTIVEQSGGMLKEDVVRKLPDWIAGAQYFDVGLFFNKQ